MQMHDLLIQLFYLLNHGSSTACLSGSTASVLQYFKDLAISFLELYKLFNFLQFYVFIKCDSLFGRFMLSVH